MNASTGLFGHGYINGYQPDEKDHPLTRAIKEVFYSVRPPEKPRLPRSNGEWCMFTIDRKAGCPGRKNHVSEMCDYHISLLGYRQKEKEDAALLAACRELMEGHAAHH